MACASKFIVNVETIETFETATLGEMVLWDVGECRRAQSQGQSLLLVFYIHGLPWHLK